MIQYLEIYHLFECNPQNCSIDYSTNMFLRWLKYYGIKTNFEKIK